MRHRGGMGHAGERHETFFRMAAPVVIPFERPRVPPVRFIPGTETLDQRRNSAFAEMRRVRQQVGAGSDSDHRDFRDEFCDEVDRFGGVRPRHPVAARSEPEEPLAQRNAGSAFRPVQPREHRLRRCGRRNFALLLRRLD